MQEQSEPLRVISRRYQKLAGITAFSKQHGAALIFIMFIVGLAVAAFTIKSFNVASMRAQQDEKTMQALGEAKEALIAWAVSHELSPGQLPWPDRREVTSPRNYDGQSDCSNANFNLLNSLSEPNFLGQIPRIASTTPCLIYPGVGHFQDSTGNNLWYAVSRNLVRNYAPPAQNPIINPSIVNNPTYPWMIIRNSVGAIISDRVAAVLIAPGPALSGQDRSGDAPLPLNFLDQVTVGATIYANHNYAIDNEDFIIGKTNTTTFNDRLVYITIDELIHAVETRAAMTAKKALMDYVSAHSGNFPYAAPLGITKGYSCNGTSNAGLLPMDAAASCTFSFTVSIGTAPPPWWPSWLPWFPNPIGMDEYAVSSSCTSDYLGNVERTIFTRTSGDDYTIADQSCMFNGLSCSCSGAGSCSGPDVPTFTCDTTGCSSANHIDNENSEIDFEGGFFSSATGACSPAAPTCETGKGYPVQCSAGNVATAGTFSSACSEDPLTGLPAWFRSNQWQDYLYYRTSRGGGPLTSGGKTGLTAILVGTGKPIVAPGIAISKGGDQAHSSCQVVDYLDSVENTNSNEVFDPHYLPRNINYNDRVYIVAP